MPDATDLVLYHEPPRTARVDGAAVMALLARLARGLLGTLVLLLAATAVVAATLGSLQVAVQLPVPASAAEPLSLLLVGPATGFLVLSLLFLAAAARKGYRLLGGTATAAEDRLGRRLAFAAAAGAVGLWLLPVLGTLTLTGVSRWLPEHNAAFLAAMTLLGAGLGSLGRRD